MAETITIRRMDFGEIFSKGFSLTMRMLRNAGAIIIVVQLLIGLAIGFLLRDTLLEIFRAAVASSNLESLDNPMGHDISSGLMSHLALIGPLELLTWLSIFFCAAVAINGSWHALMEEDISIGELIRRAFTRDMWVLIGQYFLAYLVLLAAMAGIGIVCYIFLAVSLRFMVPVLGIAAGLALIYISIAVSLGAHEVVIRQRGPWQALRGSMALLRGQWWRTFGLYVVIMIILWIIMNIVSFSVLGALYDMMTTIPRNAMNTDMVIQKIYEFLVEFPIWLFPLGAVVSAFALMVFTSAQTALHADSRARSGELAPAEDDGLQMGP